MSLFAWSAKYSLHIGQIDEQHKKLVGMLNDLFDAMKAGKGNDVLDNVLSQLIAYTKELLRNNVYTYWPGTGVAGQMV